MTHSQAYDLIQVAIAKSASNGGDAECLDYTESLWEALYDACMDYQRVELKTQWVIEARGIDDDGDEWNIMLEHAPSLDAACKASVKVDDFARAFARMVG